jgi:hypothetical protein
VLRGRPVARDSGTVFDVDWMGLLGREVLRERAAALIAESCAWAVGLSDRPHYRRRAGAVVPSGLTIGERAAAGQPLGDDEGGRLDLDDARPGTFRDALDAVGPDGVLHADRFDEEVLAPFVRDTCLLAAERARADRPADWAELADDLGEKATDPGGVVRAGGWEAPLRIDAEHLALAALGDVPLIEVEAEGLPLSLVRAAEAATRAAAPAVGEPDRDETLAGALFLAETAIRDAHLTVPVPQAQAGRLLEALLLEGLGPEEVPALLPHLPVSDEAAAKVRSLIEGAQA